MNLGASSQNGRYLAVILILVSLCSVGWVYQAGVNDSFYLDDFVNLNALGEANSIDTREEIREFVLGNHSGPTGRPVAMFSFLLDDNAWPSKAGTFKQTNIKIHLLNGFILFWLVYLLLSPFRAEGVIFYAGFVALVWLLNPMHTSTVLYPVQRMTQLSALFVMLTMVSYLKFRLILPGSHALKHWFWASMTVLFTLLGVYSKENAALIPCFILAVEVWWGRTIPWRSKLIRNVVMSGLVLSSLFLIIFLMHKTVSYGIFEMLPGRKFSTYERLITQPEVVIFYLKELLFPSLYTAGLYHDYWEPSRSFYALSTALKFFILLGSVFISIFLFRKKFYSGLALLFFFVAHIIESTGLNLELVFEHRNYLASIFLGFIWVDIFKVLYSYRKLGLFVIALPLLLNFFILYGRSKLWGDDLAYKEYTASAYPHSLRAGIAYSNALINRKYYYDAVSHLEVMVDLHEDQIYPWINAVLVNCLLGENVEYYKANLLKKAALLPFDGRNQIGYEKIWHFAKSKKCKSINLSFVDELFRQHFLYYSAYSLAAPGYSRLKSLTNQFYAGNPEFIREGQFSLEDVLASKNPEHLMLVAAQLATAGNYKSAMIVSTRAKYVLIHGNAVNTSKNKERFIQEINYFQSVLKSDIEAKDG